MKKYDDTEPAKSLVKYAGTIKPGKVLDIGCGKGKNVIWLARNGWQVEAVDPRQEWLDIAQQRALEQGLDNIHFDLSDIDSYSTNKQYDLTICAMVLHFLPMSNVEKAMTKLKLWTKHGGSVFVSAMSDRNPKSTRPTLFTQGQLQSYFSYWQTIKAFQIETDPMLMPGKTKPVVFYFDYLIAKKP